MRRVVGLARHAEGSHQRRAKPRSVAEHGRVVRRRRVASNGEKAPTARWQQSLATGTVTYALSHLKNSETSPRIAMASVDGFGTLAVKMPVLPSVKWS